MPDIKEDLASHLVRLENVLSNLAIKLDNLANNINHLLILFEESAKSIQEKQPESNTDLTNSLKTLLDQNKIIAKGISIIEERLRRQIPPPQSYPRYIPPTKPSLQPEEKLKSKLLP